MARTDRQRPATLRTIAQAAGVDVSTVSRVLNGSAEDAQRAASRETADEIRRWAARLNYRPNPHATSLRTARSNLVGVLVPGCPTWCSPRSTRASRTPPPGTA